jgi:cell division protein FtsZ
MSHFEMVDGMTQDAVIKVMGIGGGGGNAVHHMLAMGIKGVEFICVNTDAQALRHTEARLPLQIGSNLTRGLGAGSNPDIGRQAALEDRERLQEVIRGTDLLFVTACMGGGTGTGAAPVIAQIAKEMGVLVVAVVTKPFAFEGSRRMTIAQQGIAELNRSVDSLITVPNEKLLSVVGAEIPLLEAFKIANGVLVGAVQGIAELITRPGTINLDFADVRTVMSEMGTAMMGTGRGQGEKRAREAVEQAVASPLLEECDLSGAKGLLVNVTVGEEPGLSLGEFQEVGDYVRHLASDDAVVKIGTVVDPALVGELRVTVVVTGINSPHRQAPISVEVPKEQQPRVVNGPRHPVNYSELDPPTIKRKKPQGVPPTLYEEEVLSDIPAFLRRQAD